MNKSILAFCMLAGLTACTTMDEPQPQALDNHETSVLLSQKRSPEEAKACALQAFADFYGTSRGLSYIKDVKCVISEGNSRSEANDTSFYVVNLEDNEGYTVIAADRSTEPVLAVTEKGNIESIDSIDNPGAEIFFAELLGGWNINPNIKPIEPIDSSTIIKPNPWWTGGDVNPYPDTPQYKDEIEKKDYYVDPRAPFAWGQTYPEGMNCPNGIAGCVNVACALTASYFEEPFYILAGKLAAGNLITIDWPLIKQHKQSWFNSYHDACGSMDSPEHVALAEICYAFALRNDSKFKSKSTSASLNDARETLKTYSKSLNIGKLVSGMPNACKQLGNGIIMVGAHEGTPDSGHAFVIDGYHNHVVIEKRLRRDPGESGWYEVSRTVTEFMYNHINWGWCGADNGYFRVDVFNTEKGDEYDNTLVTQESHNYISDFSYFTITK